jgi:signal transduction histidine kinase
MRIVLYTLVAALVLSLTAVTVSADQTVDAKNLVQKAVATVKEKGLDATLKAINDLKGPFVKGNLYIFAMSLGNKRLAAGSPVNQPLLGTVAKASFNLKMAEVAKGPGEGWVEYSWPKPDEKKPSAKRAFIMRVPGCDAYFGCGYYTK